MANNCVWYLHINDLNRRIDTSICWLRTVRSCNPSKRGHHIIYCIHQRIRRAYYFNFKLHTPIITVANLSPSVFRPSLFSWMESANFGIVGSGIEIRTDTTGRSRDIYDEFNIATHKVLHFLWRVHQDLTQLLNENAVEGIICMYISVRIPWATSPTHTDTHTSILLTVSGGATSKTQGG